ncbi:glycosyltransferase 87 family protein [Neolewinella lacunae]|uniref:DUF2029 domain-containing protein n=1 Tax=Neolewinella lacunae TaxID=1517758 RepID=A0A923PET0_9BACT|nr:glycosyltransferase 87 family protein [Neolewinella lacunae]MBC6992732.1 DUF2029 domain-containing protein [Neolewinella lacunae]MDN3635976.1 glycosyltransferase 87 family protein [Neolewinella lacunae]
MNKAKPILAAAALSLGVLYLGFGVDRRDFWSLFLAFALAFSAYLALLYRPAAERLPWLIGLGIVLRVALVFAFPRLSDDVYRFIWDGSLVASGHNPFAHLPAHYLLPENSVAGLTPELFALLNSPEYYTIYPPVAQGVFTLAAWLSPGSWYGAAVVMKLFLLACELGTLWVFWRLLQGGAKTQVLASVPPGEEQGKSDKTPWPPTNLLLYWLNPLILIEIMGNLHFEGAMVFFLLLAYYLLRQHRWVAAAAGMAASVASKLLPLLLLPYLIRRLWGRPFWVFSVAFGGACLLFFAPMLLAGFPAGFGDSLDLYFRKFEFNASLYYLARAYGYYEIGWNQIARFGPLLAKAAAAGILLLALLDRRRDWNTLPAGWLMAFVLYLLCATTVHPWYLSVPIALCCFTRWRFPLLWSFLIMLTYTNYVTVPYAENLWLVGVEYVAVAVFAGAEWWRYSVKNAKAGRRESD